MSEIKKFDCFPIWRGVRKDDNTGICVGVMLRFSAKSKIRLCMGNVLLKDREKEWMNITPEWAIELGNVLQTIGEIVEQKKELSIEDAKQVAEVVKSVLARQMGDGRGEFWEMGVL